MKKIIAATLLAIICILTTASVVTANDQDSNEQPDISKILEDRELEKADNISNGVNWEKLLPLIKDKAMEEWGYLPEGFGEPTGNRSMKYLQDSDIDTYSGEDVEEEFYSEVDFDRLLTAGLVGSIDTWWDGFPSAADEISSWSEWTVFGINGGWLYPISDEEWYKMSATCVGWSRDVEDYYWIFYDYDDLAAYWGAPTGAKITQYQWAFWDFDGNEVNLYGSDWCYGGW